MRKTMALLLALLMLASIFISGCAQKAPEGSATPSTAPSQTPDQTGKTKEQVSFWHYVDVTSVVEKYNKMQDEIEIVPVKMSHPDIVSKLSIALAADAGAPDIFMMTHRHFINFSSTGKLYDLTDALKDDMGKIQDSLKSIPAYNGKMYGIPMDIAPSVLWYRKDIFQENGIGEIKTWSEFEAAAEKLKAKGLYSMPVFNPAGTWGCNAVSMYLSSRGGNIFTADGKVIKNNADLDYIFTWIKEMYDKGYGEAITLNSPEMWGEFKSGKLVTWPMNTAEGKSIKLNMPELEGKWGVMPFPKWDDKEKQLSGTWGGITFGIPAQSKFKEKSAEFLKWAGLTVEGQIAASESWNAVPALKEALENDFYAKGNPYYGGDNVYKAIGETTPFYYYDWAITEKHMGTQIDLMFADKISPTEAARAFEDALSKELGR